MSDLIWNDPDDSAPPLRRPILLMAFEGLFDAGEAATGALHWIRDHAESTPMVEIDAESFFNFQETRPLVTLDADGDRSIVWPSAKVYACRTEGVRDLLIMTGTEPQLRWKSFADSVVEVARRSGAEMVVTVGSMVSMVPHTRPFPVTSSAADTQLAARLNIGVPSYQGPTGIVGIINQQVHESGFPIISVRVSVPHYVPSPPNPKATRALLRRIQQTTSVLTEYERLDADVAEWVARVDQAVMADDESRSYVSRLEQQVDTNEESLPSGDEIAAELEAFLRDNPAADDE